MEGGERLTPPRAWAAGGACERPLESEMVTASPPLWGPSIGDKERSARALSGPAAKSVHVVWSGFLTCSGRLHSVWVARALLLHVAVF